MDRCTLQPAWRSKRLTGIGVVANAEGAPDHVRDALNRAPALQTPHHPQLLNSLRLLGLGHGVEISSSIAVVLTPLTGGFGYVAPALRNLS
jgi:hypothetical protein